MAVLREERQARRMKGVRNIKRKKDEKKEGLCKRRERGNLSEKSDLQVRRKQKAGGKGYKK
jgi:hypothetical protein